MDVSTGEDEDGETVTILTGEDAGIVTVFEFGPAKKEVVARLVTVIVATDVGDVRGGNPKIEPPVYELKCASVTD